MSTTSIQKELNADLIIDILKTKGYHCINGGKYRGKADYVFAHPVSWLHSNNPLERNGSFLVYQPDLEHKENGRPLLSLVFELRKGKKIKFALEVGPASALLSTNNNTKRNMSSSQAPLQIRESLLKDLGLEDLMTTGIFDNNKPTSSCRIFNLNLLFNNLPAVSDQCDPLDLESKIDDAISFLKDINDNIGHLKYKNFLFHNIKPRQGRNLKYLNLNQFQQNNITF